MANKKMGTNVSDGTLIPLYYTDREILDWAKKEQERLQDRFSGFSLSWCLSDSNTYTMTLFSEAIGIREQEALGAGPGRYLFGHGITLCHVLFKDTECSERFGELRNTAYGLYFRLRKQMPGLHRDFTSPTW